MTKKQAEVRILIINDDFSETASIKLWLDEGMRIPWTYTHCISVQEALPRIDNADLIILKPQMEGISSPMQVFDDIGDMVFEIPIIVLASAEEVEHGLSTFVMEKGAADIVIRGKFERLVDAIEFSLIRQKRTTGARKVSDQSLLDGKNKAAGELQDSCNQRTRDQDEAATTLKASKDQRAKDQEESKNMLSMFMGDYSVVRSSSE